MRTFQLSTALFAAGLALGTAAAGDASAQSARSAARSEVAPPNGPRASNSRIVNVNGVVKYFPEELGFYAVRGDNGVTYDPINGLPQAFQRDGLRVHLVARPVNAGSAHQVGPTVEIVRITSLHEKSPKSAKFTTTKHGDRDEQGENEQHEH